jgi:hypothetical protein
MLQEMTRWVFLITLLMAVAYVATVDSCLIGSAPQSYYRSYATLGLGLSVQAAVLMTWAVGLIGTNSSAKGLGQLLAHHLGKRLGIFLAALVLLWFSIDIVAYSLYNSGVNNKIESSRRVDAALEVCHSI